MGFEDPEYNDGIFHEILDVLTDEEYFCKLRFDRRLHDIFNLYEKDGTYSAQ
jgi:hypothetical protein